MVFRAMAAVVGISAKFFSAPSASLRDSFLSSAEKNKVRAETRRAQRRGRDRKTFLHVHHSWRDYATTREKQKAYGRFLGTIFLRAFQHPQEVARQGPANEKKHQNVKKCKIKCFFPALNPSFSCQNDPKEALFCCQYIFVKAARVS